MKSNSNRIFLVLLTFFALNSEASGMIDGPLGTWITQQASPKLGEILSQHPRFKGERIRIMAMQDGQPMAVTDLLTDQIREQLLEDLLSLANVKIVFDDEHRCNPIRVDTILGIDVHKHDSRKHRISLAMVDLKEGIWINGTNVFWQGRLSKQQRQALDTPLGIRNLGTVFKLHQSEEISEALYKQMQCNRVVATPVYFASATADGQTEVLVKLIAKIASQNLITTDPDAAASVISLHHGQGKFRLGLTNSEDPGQNQTIAEINIAEYASPLMPSRDRPPEPNMLSEIQLLDHASGENVCQANKENCIDISFELYEAAYTLIFYTVDGQTAPLSCDLPKRSRRGRQHYGLNVPVGDSTRRPSVGFYALAYQDRSAANAVHRVLRKSSSKCDGSWTSNEDWVDSLKQVLSKQRSPANWRAIHLTRDQFRTTIL